MGSVHHPLGADQQGGLVGTDDREGRVVARIPALSDDDPCCCCGNPDCTDLEDRMADWGIPLSEIKTMTFQIDLE